MQDMTTDSNKKAQRLAFISSLLEESIGRLKWNPEGACWRLADALGELSKLYPNEQGTGRFTGMGYKITSNF